MSLLSKLFGGGKGGETKPQDVDPVSYNGFAIYSEPAQQSGGYRIGARIEKEVDGEVRSHTMIRADVISNQDEAATASVNKAKQMIDEQGERIFRKDGRDGGNH